MGAGSGARRDLSAALAAAEARREAVVAAIAGRRTALPLRYWRQQAHYTVPADDAALARKALSDGTAPMGRLLERFGVTAADLAGRLELDAVTVGEMLARPRPAPLVMLDGEDAQAPGEAAAAAALHNIVDLLAEPAPKPPPEGPPPLRFFRPPALTDPAGPRILLTLLHALGERVGRGVATDEARQGRPFPLDGIVVPKIRHPEEIDLLGAALGEAEHDLGLPDASIRVALLVESGWAVAQLPEIARRAARRLCALIYGPVDHAADVGLPAISPEHPVALAARVAVVAVAGAVGVPAIDGMTLAYPVADRGLDAAANRERFLERVALVHREAREARALGMLGKWVGHPAQLFAALLAFDEGFAAERLAAEVAKLERYAGETAAGRGAMIIGGEMADRATDRHARVLLRQAVAVGRFDPQSALELGVIEPHELADARALHGRES